MDKANKGETSKEEDNELKTTKQNIVEQQGDKWVSGGAFQADNKIWTLYSRILMESGDEKSLKDKENESNGNGVQKWLKCDWFLHGRRRCRS